MKPKIVIIGAGGYGKVVLDAIQLANAFEVVGFVDSATLVGTVVLNNIKVVATQDNISSLKNEAEYFIVAIGNNKIRKELSSIAILNFKAATIIHPSAIIGLDVKIGVGSVVLANAIVNVNSKVGQNVIVNAGVIIDHDCTIGSNIHLSIGTRVGSNSSISNYVTTSIGQNINSFSKIS